MEGPLEASADGVIGGGIALAWVAAAGEARALAVITIDRPPGNRVSLAMLRVLDEVLAAIREEATVRAVLLQARGASFSAGADLRDAELAALLGEGTRGAVRLAELGQRVVAGLCELPVPTVAAARGHAVGAGACFLAACDVRVAAPDLSVRLPEVDRGMHLAWGILPRLAREFGVNATRRLALLGESLGPEALAGGAVRVVGDPDAEAHAIARALCEKPPLAVRAIKETLVRMDRRDRAIAEDDAARFAATVGSEDFGAAIGAFLSGDPIPPSYRGR